MRLTPNGGLNVSRREVQLTSTLRHPNTIARSTDYGQGPPGYIDAGRSECVPGRTSVNGRFRSIRLGSIGRTVYFTTLMEYVDGISLQTTNGLLPGLNIPLGDSNLLLQIFVVPDSPRPMDAAIASRDTNGGTFI